MGPLRRVAAWLRSKMPAGPYRLLQGIFPSGWSDPPEMGTRDLLEGFDTMPWLRAVSDKVGLAVAVAMSDAEMHAARVNGRAVRVRAAQRSTCDGRVKVLGALRKADQLAPQAGHVFIDLLRAPNTLMAGIALAKLTEVHLDLVGDAFWIVDRGPLGTPAGFWPVPPHWIIRTPTPERPSFQAQYRSWYVEIPERDVLHFHEPAPVDPYGRGSGIGWSLGDELEVDEYASKFAKALFFNQARPDFVVSGFIDGPERDEAERRWNERLRGFWRAHQPYFITGEPKFHEFARPTMDQLVYPNLRKAQRDIVLQTWGAPPELFGIVENSNRATIEAAEYLFARYVVEPRVERMRGILQMFVEREYDERLILHVPSCVPEDREFALRVAARVPQARRIDEWRVLQGLLPIGGPEGEAFPVLPGAMVAATDELLAPPAPAPKPAPPVAPPKPAAPPPPNGRPS